MLKKMELLRYTFSSEYFHFSGKKNHQFKYQKSDWCEKNLKKVWIVSWWVPVGSGSGPLILICWIRIRTPNSDLLDPDPAENGLHWFWGVPGSGFSNSDWPDPDPAENGPEPQPWFVGRNRYGDKDLDESSTASSSAEWALVISQHCCGSRSALIRKYLDGYGWVLIW